jgi:hypothetical protein
MNQSLSPYSGIYPARWSEITRRLIGEFPLSAEELVAAVENAWSEFYSSRIGSVGLLIGSDIFLPAQATGVILERLISAHLARRHRGWRSGTIKSEKDIVCIGNPKFCFEIKTSSSKKGVYGNRSTGHRADGRTKYRSGYYLIVNYKNPTEEAPERFLRLVRFGWIDDEDWVGQDSPTGQQASISREVSASKLVTLKMFPER